MEDKKREVERLYGRLYELNKEYDKKKLIRRLITIFLFIAAKTFLLFTLSQSRTIQTFFTSLLIAAFLGTIEYYICFWIFEYYFRKCKEEGSHIEHIRKAIDEAKKEYYAELEKEQRNKHDL